MTDGRMLIRQGSVGEGGWSSPETFAYKDESHLQEVLASYPTQIPGVPEGSIAVREFPTSAGPIDICVLSPVGNITVVECKLEKNSEKRRMVVGQLIDYASALRSDGVRKFRETWASRSNLDLDTFLDPDSVENLETSISEGRINLCLAVDQIDEDIQRLVEYLNLITSDSVMVTALQLAYAKLGSVEVLVPSTFGAEIAHSKSAGTVTSTEKWTWETFLEALIDEDDINFAQELHDRIMNYPASGNHQPLWFGMRPKGSIFFHIHRARYAPFYLWINSSNRLRIFGTWRQWQALYGDQGFDQLATVLGQSVNDGSKGVPVNELDIEEFWRTAVDCDSRINGLES